MGLKYAHARMPGRELIHLVPALNLKLDRRFGEDVEEFLTGKATTLCGRTSSSWLIGTGRGNPCPWCAKRRRFDNASLKAYANR